MFSQMHITSCWLKNLSEYISAMLPRVAKNLEEPCVEDKK